MVKSGPLWAVVVPRHPKLAMLLNNNPSFHGFAGEFRHSLDGKKRVTIPSAWRQHETDDFFVIPNPLQTCLTAMPPEVFKRIGEEAKASARSQEEYRLFASRFYSNAQFVSTDKQGRLLLPEVYCTQAGLAGDTILTGSMDRFEIWSPANWTQFQDKADEVYTEVARAVGL